MDLANATVGQLLAPIENLEAAVPFYRDILGLQHLFSAPPQMAFFQCGQIRLLVGKVDPLERSQIDAIDLGDGSRPPNSFYEKRETSFSTE